MRTEARITARPWGAAPNPARGLDAQEFHIVKLCDFASEVDWTA